MGGQVIEAKSGLLRLGFPVLFCVYVEYVFLKYNHIIIFTSVFKHLLQLTTLSKVKKWLSATLLYKLFLYKLIHMIDDIHAPHKIEYRHLAILNNKSLKIRLT